MKVRHAHVETMLEEARTGYPREVCGILLGEGPLVHAVVPVPNREADSPRVRYQIAPEDLLRVQREGREVGLEIVGYYHSHPDHPARPSDTDRAFAAEGLSDGVIHVVVGIDGARRATLTAWVFRDRGGSFDREPFEIE
jgi:proteasome lid subunit RPN8/RPN11